MNKLIMTGLCFLASKVMQTVGDYQEATEDLTKLKLATLYVHAVKISRLFFICLLAAGACLMFLFMGLFLLHHIVWVYTAWDASVKVTIALIGAMTYLLIAVGIFFLVFAEDKWMKMFNSDAMVKDLTGKQ